MAEPRVFLKENRGRIEENYLEQAKNLPRVFAPVDEKLQKCTEEVALACNIYMRLCRTVTLAIIRLKYFWTMRRMV